MNKPKSYTIKEVLDNTMFSLCFEFYTSKDKGFLIKELSKESGKTVYLTSEEKYPSYTSGVLLQEYDSSKPRYKLSFGFVPFFESKQITKNILQWINDNAKVDYSTVLRVGLNYDSNNLKTLQNISDMNIGKMILKVNENWIWDKFPQMKNSPFAMSIKRLMPTNSWLNVSDVLININETFSMPIGDYYGVDFTDQTRGTIYFNYIGGENYPTKIEEVFEMFEYYAVTTYQALNEEYYSKDQLNELRRITSEYKKLQKCYYNAERFLSEFENIKVTVDLVSNPQTIKSYWTVLRDPLLKVILESDMKEGRFNLDTDSGFYQLKNVKLDGVKLKNFELVSSEVTGIIENCHMWKTKINNSRIENSTLVQNNTVNESNLLNVRADKQNKINKSYIINNGEIINCKVTESILRNAGLGSSAKLDEDTTVIDKKQPTFKPTEGIKVDQVRDYRWIKGLTERSESSGFANEYKDN